MISNGLVHRYNNEKCRTMNNKYKTLKPNLNTEKTEGNNLQKSSNGLFGNANKKLRSFSRSEKTVDFVCHLNPDSDLRRYTHLEKHHCK